MDDDAPYAVPKCALALPSLPSAVFLSERATAQGNVFFLRSRRVTVTLGSPVGQSRRLTLRLTPLATKLGNKEGPPIWSVRPTTYCNARLDYTTKLTSPPEPDPGMPPHKTDSSQQWLRVACIVEGTG